MTIKNELWAETFSLDGLPQWPCPNCGLGRLSSAKNSVKVIEPTYSKRAHTHDAWEPDWITERFLALMKCSNLRCQEIVVVSGDTVFSQVEDEETGWHFASQLRPKCIFPAPSIIDIPEETPGPVAQEINIACQLFWSDLGSSASRLRTSVERIMDDFKIPKTMGRARRNARFRTLASRIGIFKAKKPQFGDHLDALRHVGNLGTHAEADRQSLLAGFAVYEDALEEIYGKRSKKTKRLTKKLIKGKGKLK